MLNARLQHVSVKLVWKETGEKKFEKYMKVNTKIGFQYNLELQINHSNQTICSTELFDE